ncbi:MAG: PIG-L deacetylase family protein [Actinomycetota bacterium]
MVEDVRRNGQGSWFSKALVFAPHPDDSEFFAGGTMARWTSEGTEVILCVVTNGAAGSNDPTVEREWLIATREREQRKAAAILGVSEVVFLGQEDGFVEDSHGLRRDLIREIRRHKPDVVLGPDPSTFYFGQWFLNHPDHRRVGEALLAAVNPGASTVPLYRAELFDRGFLPHTVKACLLSSATPDYFVDITNFMDVKVAALSAHESQVGGADGLVGVMRSVARMMAECSDGDYSYAEGFKAFFFASLLRDPR